MAFPVCSAKVTPRLHFPGVAPRLSYQEVLAQEASRAVESSMFPLEREPANIHPQAAVSTHPIHVSSDQGFLMSRDHNPLGGVLALTTSSHLKKRSILHEESEVKKL